MTLITSSLFVAPSILFIPKVNTICSMSSLFSGRVFNNASPKVLVSFKYTYAEAPTVAST